MILYKIWENQLKGVIIKGIGWKAGFYLTSFLYIQDDMES